MDIIQEWFDTYKDVLTNPTGFFESEDRRDGFGFSLKFAAINLLISGILAGISIAALGPAIYGLENVAGMGVLAVLMTVLTPIIGLVSLFISAGIIHIFASLLGAENGYSETLSAMEYATVIQPIASIFSLIPLLGSLINLLVGIYGIFIQTRGLENFQELSVGRALAAILLPAVLVIALIVLVVVLAVGASFASIAAA